MRKKPRMNTKRHEYQPVVVADVSRRTLAQREVSAD